MYGRRNRLTTNQNPPATARVASKRLFRPVALTGIALLCALATPILRAPVFALATNPAGPNPVTLGEKIFADVSLSASGAMACATCHDPLRAHAQSNDLPVQLGGANLDVPGFRAVPSLQYISLMPAFFFADDGTPTGGFNRDGRAKDLLVQALRPLFTAHEMANATPADLVARLASAPYAGEFRQVFGQNIFDDEQGTVLAVTFALAQYQKLDPDFRPFDSKYDYFLAGKLRLEPAELRGLALFNRADKGGLCGVPSERARAGQLAADVHRFHLRQPRRAAQYGHPRERRPGRGARRPRNLPEHAYRRLPDCAGSKTMTVAAQRRRVHPFAFPFITDPGASPCCTP
jgi:cytochrome c peroxidase